MKLRRVNTEDAKALVSLMSQLGYESTESELRHNIETHSNNNNSWAYVIEIDTKPVASASYHLIPYFHQEGALMRLSSLVVDANHKRKGLGKILMNQAVTLAKENNCDRIELTTSAHRSAEAHHFYQSLGYKEYSGIRFLKDISIDLIS